MNFENFKYKANYYALILLAFVIPLERKLIAPITIVFLVTCLINFKRSKISSKKNLFFGILYPLYLFGLLYTSNISFGMKDLMTKLPLLLLPLGFYFTSLKIGTIRSKVFSSFIDGCIASFTIALIHSTYQYFFTQNLGHFFYDRVALFAHPSYLAMMFTFAITLLYMSLLRPTQFNFEISKSKQLILIGIFTIYTMLLLSKTGIFTCLLVHLGALLFWIKTSKKYVLGLGIFGIVIILFTLSYTSSSTLQKRFSELGTLSESEGEGLSSTSSRLSIWKISGELIAQQPFIGYGTGDVKDVLLKSYSEHNYNYLAEKKLNAHNQLIQTTLSIGIIGGLFLLLMLLLPAIWSVKTKNYLYLFFLLLILVNFTTESMLERQVGVTFYALFNLLCLSFNQEKKSELV